MALFRGIQEYIALDANNFTLVFDSGNIVNISGNIFLYPPQGHPIVYNYHMGMSYLLCFLCDTMLFLHETEGESNIAYMKKNVIVYISPLM